MTRWVSVVCVAALAACLVGCKTAPAPTTEFLGNDKPLAKDPEIQVFQKMWYKADADWDKYKKIVIPPVNTDHLLKMGWWEKASLKGQVSERDVQDLAYFMRTTFIEAQKKNTHFNRLLVTNVPDEETVILELAIIEVVPTKAWLNWISYASALMVLDQGSIAFEARLRDGKTREILAKFADREMGKANVIGNIKDFGWYGHVKAAIREWADQVVQVGNSEPGEVVKDSSAFEWKVW